MKKILLTGSLIVASLALANAQGTIKFNNNTSTYYVSTNGVANGGTVGVTDKVAGDYYYELLYDVSTPASSNPATGGWSSTGLVGTNGVVFGGGITGPGAANGVAVSQVAPGASAYFEVVGWSASLNGLSLTQMLADYQSGNWGGLQGYFGFSSASAGALTLGGLGTPATLPPALFGGASGIQNGFDLNAIPTPEPASIALAGLGGLALLGLRRKK